MRRRWALRCALGPFVLAGLVACQRECAPVVGAANVEAEREAIRSESNRWFQAIAAKDLEKTLSFYAPDARYLSAGRPAAATPQERRKLWMEDYGLPGFSSDEATTEIEVARSGELAFQRGTYVSTAQTAQGKILRSTGKFLVIWKKTPTGGWQAIVDIDNADQ